MRLTTKIILGIIAGIFILSIGFIIGFSFTDLKDNRKTHYQGIEIPQEEKATIELDDHKVVYLEEIYTGSDKYWDTHHGSLSVKPASRNDGKAGLIIPQALKEFMDIEVVNDTLYIKLLMDSLLEVHPEPEKESHHPVVRGVNLVLYTDLPDIKNQLNIGTHIADVHTDSLLVTSEKDMTIENSSANYIEVHVRSHRQLLLKDSYFKVMDMNLDNMGSWTSENTKVDVVNLSGKGKHNFRLADKEIGRIYWHPSHKEATLNLVLPADTTEVILP